MHLTLCSALKAPLPLPGSYFSALLAAPSSSGCFYGRGAVLETQLPFIALNVTRRSLSSVPPPRASLLAMAQREGMRVFFPIAFLQMDNTLPAVPAALWSRAVRPPGVPNAFSNPEEGVRMLGGRDSLWSPSPAPLRPPFWGPNCCQRGCAGAQQSAGFYCQVVLNRVVPGVVCWWPHEIAVLS